MLKCLSVFKYRKWELLCPGRASYIVDTDIFTNKCVADVFIRFWSEHNIIKNVLLWFSKGAKLCKQQLHTIGLVILNVKGHMVCVNPIVLHPLTALAVNNCKQIITLNHMPSMHFAHC